MPETVEENSLHWFMRTRTQACVRNLDSCVRNLSSCIRGLVLESLHAWGLAYICGLCVYVCRLVLTYAHR